MLEDETPLQAITWAESPHKTERSERVEGGHTIFPSRPAQLLYTLSLVHLPHQSPTYQYQQIIARYQLLEDKHEGTSANKK